MLIQSGYKSMKEHHGEIKKQYFDIEMIPTWDDQESYKRVMLERKQLHDYIIDLLKIPTCDKK